MSPIDPPPPFTRANVEAALARDDADALARAVIAAALGEEDAAWAEDVCLRLAAHPRANVRGNAVLALGHLARIHGRLGRGRALPVLEAALADADEYVRGQAHAAVDDVEHFLGWRTSRPNPLRDWMEGGLPTGVGFRRNETARIESGSRAGAAGSVVFLLETDPEPRYVVELSTGEDVTVPQSALRPADPEASA